MSGLVGWGKAGSAARSAARPTGAAKRMPGVPGWKVFAVRAERAASGGLDPVEHNSAKGTKEQG